MEGAGSEMSRVEESASAEQRKTSWTIPLDSRVSMGRNSVGSYNTVTIPIETDSNHSLHEGLVEGRKWNTPLARLGREMTTDTDWTHPTRLIPTPSVSAAAQISAATQVSDKSNKPSNVRLLSVTSRTDTTEKGASLREDFELLAMSSVTDYGQSPDPQDPDSTSVESGHSMACVSITVLSVLITFGAAFLILWMSLATSSGPSVVAMTCENVTFTVNYTVQVPYFPNTPNENKTRKRRFSTYGNAPEPRGRMKNELMGGKLEQSGIRQESI